MSGPDPEFNALGWHNQARDEGSDLGAPTKPTYFGASPSPMYTLKLPRNKCSVFQTHFGGI